jgi:hypothetical protein
MSEMTVYMQFRKEDTDWMGGKKRKTEVWEVESSDGKTYLGTVLWRTGWRRYVFEPADRSVFDSACLGEITSFIDNLMEQWRAKREK